jgi:hypothetical protein
MNKKKQFMQLHDLSVLDVWVAEKKWCMECFSGFIESCLNIFSNTAMSFLLRYCMVAFN